MYDCFDVEAADRMAGDHRTDLDDVKVGAMIPIRWVPIPPDGVSLLDHLATLLARSEAQWLINEFYEERPPLVDGVRGDSKCSPDSSRVPPLPNGEPDNRLRKNEVAGLRRMFGNYATWLRLQYPHMTTSEIHTEVASMGHRGGRQSVKKILQRNRQGFGGRRAERIRDAQMVAVGAEVEDAFDVIDLRDDATVAL